MSIQRISDGLYRVTVWIRVCGRVTHRQTTIAGGKEQARALEQKIKAELREAAGGSLTSIKTFGEALTFYLARRDIHPRSIPYFNRLKEELGAVSLNQIGDRFDKWLLHMRNHVATKTGSSMANGTLNRYRTWANAALNFAVKRRILKRNPVANIEPLEETARDVSLTDEQERRLLNVIDAKAPHLGPAVRFMLQVPCRKSEVVNMKIEDVDIINECIRVRNGRTKNNAGIDKPIPPGLIGYMRSIPAGCEHVFYREEKGCYFSLGDFKHAWDHCRKLAGVPDLRVHDLRHIAATRLVDAGTPEQVVMEVAGWKTNMLRIYYHRNPKKALALVRFGGAVNSGVNSQRLVGVESGVYKAESAFLACAS